MPRYGRKRSRSFRRRYGINKRKYRNLKRRLSRRIARRVSRAEVKHKDTYQQLDNYVPTNDSGFIVNLNENIKQGLGGGEQRIGDKIFIRHVYAKVYFSWGTLPETELADKVNCMRIIMFLYWNRDNPPTIHDYRTGLLDVTEATIDHGIASYQWNRQYRYRILYDKVKRVYPGQKSQATFMINRRIMRTVEYNYLNEPDLNIGLAIIGGSLVPITGNTAYSYVSRVVYTDA